MAGRHERTGYEKRYEDARESGCNKGPCDLARKLGDRTSMSPGWHTSAVRKLNETCRGDATRIYVYETNPAIALGVKGKEVLLAQDNMSTVAM